MTSSVFPDVNVWMALLLENHVHRHAAEHWWRTTPASIIAFARYTQMSVLRLLTTAAAMSHRPLTMASAWIACDRFFEDNRVALLPEPVTLDATFRRYAAGNHASPKLWADAYLAAFATEHGGSIVTFDRGLSKLVPDSILLAN